MIEIKAPEDYSAIKGVKSVFLAGSIEMGTAEEWQARMVSALRSFDVLILNPRRDDWDASWVQSRDNPEFRQQVEWELEALEKADMIAMYFAPGSKSPITLLELGLHAGRNPGRLAVCCPEGFWRKGNVDIVCARYGVTQVSTLEDLAGHLAARLRKAA